MSQLADVVRRTIKSLKEEPGDWTFDYFAARNSKLRLEVWLANGYYGLHIKVGGLEFGGVTGLSTFFGPLIPWRRRLRRAALNAATAYLFRDAARAA